jgi:hypothetical protein
LRLKNCRVSGGKCTDSTSEPAFISRRSSRIPGLPCCRTLNLCLVSRLAIGGNQTRS